MALNALAQRRLTSLYGSVGEAPELLVDALERDPDSAEGLPSRIPYTLRSLGPEAVKSTLSIWRQLNGRNGAVRKALAAEGIVTAAGNPPRDMMDDFMDGISIMTRKAIDLPGNVIRGVKSAVKTAQEIRDFRVPGGKGKKGKAAIAGKPKAYQPPGQVNPITDADDNPTAPVMDAVLAELTKNDTINYALAGKAVPVQPDDLVAIIGPVVFIAYVTKAANGNWTLHYDAYAEPFISHTGLLDVITDITRQGLKEDPKETLSGPALMVHQSLKTCFFNSYMTPAGIADEPWEPARRGREAQRDQLRQIIAEFHGTKPPYKAPPLSVWIPDSPEEEVGLIGKLVAIGYFSDRVRKHKVYIHGFTPRHERRGVDGGPLVAAAKKMLTDHGRNANVRKGPRLGVAQGARLFMFAAEVTPDGVQMAGK